MGSDDLRALIEAYRRAGDREREDRLRDHATLIERLDTMSRELRDKDRRDQRWRGYFAALAFVAGVLAWFGPTRLASLLKALFGAGP